MAAALGTFLLLVGDLFNLSTSVWAPKEAVLVVLGAAGVPLLVARAIGRSARRSAPEVWAARFAVGFLVAGLIATMGARVPVVLAMLGRYGNGTGLVFWVAVAGCWALGTAATDVDRRWIEGALVAGAAVNAAVVVLQTFHDLTPLGVPYYGGTVPAGLMGNPVFTGPVMAGALAVVAVRLERNVWRWGAVGVLLGAAIGMSTERLPALLAVGVLGWGIAASRKANPRGHPARRHAWWLAAATAGAVVGGSEAGRAFGPSSGVLAHVASSTAVETYGQRFHAWADGLRAIGAHPLFGAGPGQFAAATLPHLTLADAHANGASSSGNFYFDDAHNLFIELAVTTGLVGLALFVGWLVPAFIGKRGPLVAVAVVLLTSGLIEPLNVDVTPLAMLALGAAAFAPGPSPRRRRAEREGGGEVRQQDDATPRGKPPDGCVPRWVRPSAAVLALLTAVPAIVLVVGDVALQRATTEFGTAQAGPAFADGTTANDLLRPWPDPALELAQISILDLLDRRPGARAHIYYWARQAALRSPADATLWMSLANYQMKGDDVSGARASAARALADEAWNFGADNLLGDIASLSHHPSAARSYWRTSLLVNPHQAEIRAFLDGRCQPPDPSAKFSPPCKS